MMMRYLGGGIGHFDQHTTENPASGIADDTGINEDEAEQTQSEEIGVNKQDDTTSDIGHDEAEYYRPKGSDADEDSPENTSGISNTEEANGFMSEEEDFIDDLYDL
ncbi:hypothetical protein RhiTH_008993 [Rhizoctonia solani]